MSQTTEISRRSFLDRFLQGGLIALIAAVLYPVVRYIIPPAAGEVNVSQVKLGFTREDIEATKQKSKLFKFGRALGIILITPEGKLQALEATCTHLDCTVQYRPDLGVVWCACHNGRYDLNGNNISGPPPRPLKQFAVNEVGQDIFISHERS
jgi:Rieske Fe-S protein